MKEAILFLGVICLTFMFGLKLSGRQLNENLSIEDGGISATALPLDVELANKAYETATFGIG